MISELAAQYIVGFLGEVPDDAREGRIFHGGTVLRVDHDLVFALVETHAPVAFEASAARDDRVRYFERNDPHYAFLTLVPNDALYGDPGHWGSKKIGAEAAWDRTTGTTAVKVAMIDSGINRDHEEFAGQSRVLQGRDFFNLDNDPDDTSACSFHGTHTTGTAGSTINNGRGIAGLSQHTILPIKVFDQSLFGCGSSQQAIVDGLKYSGDQGAHISSNSWGSMDASVAISDAVQYAHDRGVITVAAAGNSGPCTDCVLYPWKDMGHIVIVTAATDSNDGQASFSSEGPEVDVAAPGVDIISTCGPATTDYCTYSGTSMATPHASGTAALVKALNPDFTFADMENRLKSTAVDLGPAGEDNDFGAGRIDADAATADGAPPPPPPGENQPPTADFTFSCSGLTCDFDGTASSDPDGTIQSYDWDFGDGATGTGATVTNTYGADGTYTVTLTVTDDEGATDSVSKDVTVSESPPPPPEDAMHVHRITHLLFNPHLWIEVNIRDGQENVVEGATVTITICKQGGSCVNGSAKNTNENGNVAWVWFYAGSGTYTTCVTSLTHPTLTWDETADHAGDGSCRTDTV